MQSSLRPNIKLILAAICVIAGVVILWRSFAQPPIPVAEGVLPVSTSVSEPEAPLPDSPQLSPTVSDPAPTQSAPAQQAPTAIEAPTVGVPTPLVPTQLSAPTSVVNTGASPLPATAPVVVATQASLPTQAIATAVPPTLTANPTATGVAVATITPIATAIPALVATSTAQIVPTNTTQPEQLTDTPTATLAVGTATATPSSTATPTLTLAPVTATSTSNASVVYRVEGAASKVVVSYLDGNGKENTVEVTLPWRIQFTAALDADLAVDAFSTNNEAVVLTCAIEINGTTLLTDQTENAINGVACERFIN